MLHNKADRNQAICAYRGRRSRWVAGTQTGLAPGARWAGAHAPESIPADPLWVTTTPAQQSCSHISNVPFAVNNA
jgi:hypothetical protein